MTNAEKRKKYEQLYNGLNEQDRRVFDAVVRGPQPDEIYNAKPKDGPTYLSMFSGIGTAEEAARQSGLIKPGEEANEITAELNPHSYATLLKNYPESKNLGDVTKINFKQLFEKYGIPKLITGGFSCQPFSGLGQRLGLYDPHKGQLVGKPLAAVGTAMDMGAEPNYIFENVGQMSKAAKSLIGRAFADPWHYVNKDGTFTKEALREYDTLREEFGEAYTDAKTGKEYPAMPNSRDIKKADKANQEITRGDEFTAFGGNHLFFSNAKQPSTASEDEIWPGGLSLADFFNTETGQALIKGEKDKLGTLKYWLMKRQADKMHKLTDEDYRFDVPKDSKFSREVSGNRSGQEKLHENANRSTHMGLYLPNPNGFYKQANYGISRGKQGGKEENGRKSYLFPGDQEGAFDFQRLDHDALDWLYGFKPGHTNIGSVGELIDLHKEIMDPNFRIEHEHSVKGPDGKKHKEKSFNPEGKYFTDSTARTDRQRKLGNTYTVQQIWQQMHRLFPDEIDPPSDERLKDFTDYDNGLKKTRHIREGLLQGFGV